MNRDAENCDEKRLGAAVGPCGGGTRCTSVARESHPREAEAMDQYVSDVSFWRLRTGS